MRSPRSTPIVSCGCLKISFLFFATVIIFFTAGLLSLVLRARRLLGAYRIPMETGLLIPSGKSAYRTCGLGTIPLVRFAAFIRQLPGIRSLCDAKLNANLLAVCRCGHARGLWQGAGCLPGCVPIAG